ncbi:MAG: nucleotidyltransferase domain-containing protein [Ignavibacteriales bacterium]|nr:nucleotidyltransferase domain-containing protein [Ignavibacteriales bacterium]
MALTEVIDLVKNYINELNKDGITIDKAFVFGSHAEGIARPDSDIDVMLVSKLFDDDKMKYISKIWHMTKISGFKIEPVAIGLKRFLEDDYSPLIGIVKKEGIEIN